MLDRRDERVCGGPECVTREDLGLLDFLPPPLLFPLPLYIEKGKGKDGTAFLGWKGGGGKKKKRTCGQRQELFAWNVFGAFAPKIGDP